MTFRSFLERFLQRTVEVFVPGSVFEGTLISVQNATIQIEEPPISYGQPIIVTIPTDNIEYVRVLA